MANKKIDKIPEPKDIGFGVLNDMTPSLGIPDLSMGGIVEKLRDEYQVPDITKNKNGRWMAIALERARIEQLPYDGWDITQHQENSKGVIVVRACNPDQYCVPTPDQEIRAEDGSIVPPEFITACHLEYTSTDESLMKMLPEKGDFIWVTTENSKGLKRPRYLGIAHGSTRNSGLKENKKDGSILDKAKASLADFLNPPTSENPIPQENMANSDANFQVTKETKKDGWYDVHRKSKTPTGQMYMVTLDGGTLLFPIKYIKALEKMRSDYFEQKGKKLSINSAFRTHQEQIRLYNQDPSNAAEPGFSKHQIGEAVDFGTGADFNLKYKNSGIRDLTTATRRTSINNFGEVAQWLVENSEKYGFKWTGYAFKELWHYELDMDLLKNSGIELMEEPS